MSMSLLIPPEEPLKDVFTVEVIERLKTRSSFSESAKYRLEVLSASGPDVKDWETNWEVSRLRAQKAAWDIYIYTAFANGLFEGTDGNDLRGRLTSPDDGDFRSGMAECLACWVFSGKL